MAPGPGHGFPASFARGSRGFPAGFALGSRGSRMWCGGAACRGRLAFLDVEADGVPDLVKRYSKLIFNSFDGDVENLGDLPVLEAVFLGQFENEAAFGRQLVDGLLDKRQHIGGDEHLFRVEVDAGEVGLIVLDGEGGVASLAVEVVDGDIAGADVEIDLQVPDLFELFPFLPHLNKYVRDDFLRGLLFLDDRPGEGI